MGGRFENARLQGEPSAAFRVVDRPWWRRGEGVRREEDVRAHHEHVSQALALVKQLEAKSAA
jgi:hypothetical protein